MITQVTIYETTDGSQFGTLEEAEKYEALYERCEKVMFRLKPHGDYGQAVKQDPELVKEAYHNFLDICVEVIPTYKKWFEETKAGTRHQSWASKVISDYGIECLSHLMFRFSCTNMTSGIEYEQPYYVEHESEWKGEML